MMREWHTLIRTYSISTKASIDALLLSLRARKVNGEIRIVLNQGGTRQVTFEEQTRIQSASTPEILEILNKS